MVNENPQSFTTHQITSEAEWNASIMPRLRDLIYRLPGTADKHEQIENEWIPGWKEVGPKRCEDTENNYCAVTKNAEGEVCGLIMACRLNTDRAGNLEAFDTLKSETGFDDVSPEEVLYVDNIITLPESQGQGFKLMTDLRNFVKGHPTYRYILLRTDKNNNERVVRLYEAIKSKLMGTFTVTEGEGKREKLLFIKDLKPEEDVKSQVEETLQ